MGLDQDDRAESKNAETLDRQREGGDGSLSRSLWDEAGAGSDNTLSIQKQTPSGNAFELQQDALYDNASSIPEDRARRTGEMPAVRSGGGDAGTAVPDVQQGKDGGRGHQPDAASDRGALGSPPAGFRFPGEIINRQVEPGTHTFHRGETLDQIATQHLGQGASPDQVAAYAREIARHNRVEPGHIPEGRELVLPGHTESGGFVTADATGDRRTVWQDGVTRVEHTNGTGYVERPQADGSINIHHWGRGPQENYELVRTADGHFRVADNGQTPVDVTDHSNLVTEQRILNAMLETRLGGFPDSVEHMRTSMRDFEARQDVSPEERARTYHEISRLLDARGNEHTQEGDRLLLAEQVLAQAAHPTSVEQGDHNTCAAATLESRIYTRNPAAAAQMVADVAITGSFTPRDPGATPVRIPDSSLALGVEERGESDVGAPRTYASQIFQVTAVNVSLARHGYDVSDSERYGPGQLRYEQHEPTAGGRNREPHNGEVLVDTATGRPIQARFEGLRTDAIQDLGESITGRRLGVRETEFVLEQGPERPATVDFQSEADLTRVLQDASTRHTFPVIIRIDDRNEPFRSELGIDAAAGEGGGHYVTVTDFDPATGRVSVDNQWGENRDHRIMPNGEDRRLNVADLYRATLAYDANSQGNTAQRNTAQANTARNAPRKG